MRRLGLRMALTLALALSLSGCSGIQSALAPAGRGAEQIAKLFWWMAAGAVVVWCGVILLVIFSIHSEARNKRQTAILIIGGGVIVPTLVLAVLLTYGLSMIPGMLAPAPPGSIRISVVGEQWWWRIQYEHPSAGTVHLANEIRLPVGEAAEFHLTSFDVVHSFWIPALGPKMDMIPGRSNRLTLHPTRVGRFRGICAEYCGTSHALMAIDVVVLEKKEFVAWLARQSQIAISPVEPIQRQGHEIFLASGCGACHSIRGTKADGVVGPDLTHVGGRLSLGAGILPNDTESLIRWITHTESVKPGVHMPHFGMLQEEEFRALAAYLESLK